MLPLLSGLELGDQLRRRGAVLAHRRAKTCGERPSTPTAWHLACGVYCDTRDCPSGK